MGRGYVTSDTGLSRNSDNVAALFQFRGAWRLEGKAQASVFAELRRDKRLAQSIRDGLKGAITLPAGRR